MIRNLRLDREMLHRMTRGDGINCVHPAYGCHALPTEDKQGTLLIPTWPILDTKLDPPAYRIDIRMGCLCECPDCHAIRETLTDACGVDGYLPGIYSANMLDALGIGSL